MEKQEKIILRKLFQSKKNNQKFINIQSLKTMVSTDISTKSLFYKLKILEDDGYISMDQNDSNVHVSITQKGWKQVRKFKTTTVFLIIASLVFFITMAFFVSKFVQQDLNHKTALMFTQTAVQGDSGKIEETAEVMILPLTDPTSTAFVPPTNTPISIPTAVLTVDSTPIPTSVVDVLQIGDHLKVLGDAAWNRLWPNFLLNPDDSYPEVIKYYEEVAPDSDKESYKKFWDDVVSGFLINNSDHNIVTLNKGSDTSIMFTITNMSGIDDIKIAGFEMDILDYGPIETVYEYLPWGGPFLRYGYSDDGYLNYEIRSIEPIVVSDTQVEESLQTLELIGEQKGSSDPEKNSLNKMEMQTISLSTPIFSQLPNGYYVLRVRLKYELPTGETYLSNSQEFLYLMPDNFKGISPNGYENGNVLYKLSPSTGEHFSNVINSTIVFKQPAPIYLKIENKGIFHDFFTAETVFTFKNPLMGIMPPYPISPSGLFEIKDHFSGRYLYNKATGKTFILGDFYTYQTGFTSNENYLFQLNENQISFYDIYDFSEHVFLIDDGLTYELQKWLSSDEALFLFSKKIGERKFYELMRINIGEEELTVEQSFQADGAFSPIHITKSLEVAFINEDKTKLFVYPGQKLIKIFEPTEDCQICYQSDYSYVCHSSIDNNIYFHNQITGETKIITFSYGKPFIVPLLPEGFVFIQDYGGKISFYDDAGDLEYISSFPYLENTEEKDLRFLKH